MSRHPHQPPGAMTVVQGQFHVPHRLIPPPPPGKVWKVEWLERLLFKIPISDTILSKLQSGEHATRTSGKTVGRVSKAPETEIMRKKKIAWYFPGTQSIGHEFSGRAFMVATLLLGTCFCLYCLLLDSELFKDEDLSHSYPCSQWLVWCLGHHRPYRSSKCRNGEMNRGQL